MPFSAGACTMPRNHWTGPPYSSHQRLGNAGAGYSASPSARLNQISSSEEDPTPDTPLMISKIESTV